MSEGLRGNPVEIGDAYHRLFMGEDSDLAEAAAVHFGTVLELVRQYLAGDGKQ